jgi:transposase
MPRKRNLDPVRQSYHSDLKKRIVYQVYTLGMSTTSVAISLNMPLRVIQRVLKAWKTTGEVCRDRRDRGRAPLMKRDAVKVCSRSIPHKLLLSVLSFELMLALIEHTPDIYLDEIQEELREQHGLTVSLATIWRTLKRLGISSKKVWQPDSPLWAWLESS